MPIIALTFDDGPNTVITPQVLDLLEEHGILASFFLIARNITPESAEVVRRAKKMGCDIEPTDDGMIIHGGRPLHGADINTYQDHRLAMSFTIAALAAEGTTRIIGDECIGISYPSFFGDLQNLL